MFDPDYTPTDQELQEALNALDPSLDGDEEVEFADTQYSDYPIEQE